MFLFLSSVAPYISFKKSNRDVYNPLPPIYLNKPTCRQYDQWQRFNGVTYIYLQHKAVTTCISLESGLTPIYIYISILLRIAKAEAAAAVGQTFKAELKSSLVMGNSSKLGHIRICS